MNDTGAPDWPRDIFDALTAQDVSEISPTKTEITNADCHFRDGFIHYHQLC